jgi:hypothetical protein
MIDAEVRWQRRPDHEGGGTRFTLRKESAPPAGGGPHTATS